MGILGLFVLGSCQNKAEHNHDHEGHNHETEEAHGHDGHSQAKADAHEGCTHDHDDHAGHNHEAEDSHAGHNHEAEGQGSADSHADEIILPKQKAEAAGVKSIVVKPGSFRQVIKTSGQVLAAQGDESTAVATVAGVVSFAGKVTEGMSVGRGASLLTIASSGMAEGDPVQRARVDYEIAQKEYERMQKLAQSQIVSEKDLAQARQVYENTRISYEALGKNHSAKGQSITAPIGGFVKSILVKEGDYVTVGQPLVSITQNRRLFLRAELSERYYASLRSIQSANFCTPYNNKVYELDALGGKLLSFGKSAGDNSFYIPVTFEFDNKGDIIPGSYVEAYLLSTEMPDVIALPRTALTEEQGNYFVYLQLDEEGYKKQEVAIGTDNGQSVRILSGVKAGDRVVTEGAYQVKLASVSNALPAHSHEH